MKYPSSLSSFDEIGYCDTEYHAPAGQLPAAICIVIYLERQQRVMRLWVWGRRVPPIPQVLLEKNLLFVSYNLPAEYVLFLTMGWPLPIHALDLNVEVRNLTNGLRPTTFISLHEAAKEYHIPYLDKAYKDRMRNIAIAGGPAVEEHKRDLLKYCEDDTRVLVPLLHAILPKLSLPHALLRGQFMREQSTIEHRGIPINTEGYTQVIESRQQLRDQTAAQANADLGCSLFDGDSLRDRTFAAFIKSVGLLHLWPLTPTGKLKKDVEETLTTFRHVHPKIEILRTAKKTLDDLKSISLAIGEDGRNRFGGGAFGTITSRHNPPRYTETILHRARGWRNFIQPTEGKAVAELDFSAEEFLVLAVLANDPQGLADYYSGDVYTTFGRIAGLPLPGLEAKVPGKIREMLKVVVLGIPYGMRAPLLAMQAGINVEWATRLLSLYRTRYPRMAAYGDQSVLRGVETRQLRTRLDWRLHVDEIIKSKREWGHKKKPANVLTVNTLRDWPIQANAAEILRLSVIQAASYGVQVIATLHDSLLIESSTEQIEEDVRLARLAMQQASQEFLYLPPKRPGPMTPGYGLWVDSSVVHYPDHFREKSSFEWWERLRRLLFSASGYDLEKSVENVLVAP